MEFFQKSLHLQTIKINVKSEFQGQALLKSKILQKFSKTRM